MSDTGDDNSEIASKFDGDWSGILANIRQIKSLMPTDPENVKAQVAHYGEIQEQIVKFMKWASQKLTDEEFYPRLVIYGDQLSALNEFTAATLFCYDPCIQALGESPTTQFLPCKVSSMFGRGLGAFNIAKYRDSSIQFPQTLNQAISTLSEIQDAMNLILKRDTKDQENLAYLILNGTVHLYSICEPLISLGFSEHAVEFVTWSVLSMEAIVNLSTTRHLPWRNKLYTAICHCYEDMSCQKARVALSTKSKKKKARALGEQKLFLKTAQVVVTKAQEKLQQLIEEESEDPPLPPGFDELTTKMRTDYNILLFKYKAAATPEEVPALLKELFNDDATKLRALLEAIINPTRTTLARQAPDENLAPLVQQITSSLFKLLTPFAEELGGLPASDGDEEEEPPADDEDVDGYGAAEPEEVDADTTFPLTLHFSLLKEFFSLAQWDTVGKLLKWGRARMEEGVPLPSQKFTVLQNEYRILQALYDLQIGPPPPPAEEPAAEEGEEGAEAAEAEEAEASEEEEEPAEPIPDPLADRVNIGGKEVPIAFLMALSKALRCCTKGPNRIMCEQRRDLVTAAALDLSSMSTELVGTADALKASCLIDDKLASVTVHSLMSVHVILAEVDYDDPLLRCRCVLQLALLLEKTQDDLRMAVQVLRYSLEKVNETRANAVSHFLHKPTDPADRTALTRMAFLTEVDDATAAAGLSRPSGGHTKKKQAAVFGSGSKLDPLDQALAAAHVDVVSTLIRIELQLGLKLQSKYVSHRQKIADDKQKAHDKQMAAMTGDDKKQKLKAASTTVDVNAAKREAAKKEAEAKAAEAKSASMHSSPSAPAEARLMAECRGNSYWRAILQTHMASLRDSGSREQEQLLRSAMLEVNKAKASEAALVAGADASQQAAPKPSKLPAPPTIISRTPTSITLMPKIFIPTKAGAQVAFFRAYAKPAGAGTSVSLNNTEYPGTNTDSPAVLDEATGGYCTPASITVGGLLPNEIYVAAVAAYDAAGKVISGVGITSLPVEALCPLPVLVIMGYIAKRAKELGHRATAQEAGGVLYQYFVRAEGQRSLWAANPMQAHSLRPERVDRASRPLLQTFVQVLRDVLVEESRKESNSKSVVIVADQDEPSILLPQQVKALLSVRKMVMATELAARIEEPGLLLDSVCKAHRLMVPLLRLKRRGPYMLQAMVTLHQAMQLVPLERWDAVAKQVFACVTYEMTLAGRELREDDAIQFALMKAGGKGLLTPPPADGSGGEEEPPNTARTDASGEGSAAKAAISPQIDWQTCRGDVPGAGTTEEQEALEEFLYTLPMYERVEREGGGGEEEAGAGEEGGGDDGPVKLSEASAMDPAHERPSTQACTSMIATAKARAEVNAATPRELAEGEEPEPEAAAIADMAPEELERLVPDMWEQLNQSPEQGFHTLQEKYKDHPRYLEYACKVLRYCLARGGKENVGALLDEIQTPSTSLLSPLAQAALKKLTPTANPDLDDSVLQEGTQVEVWCRTRNDGGDGDGGGLPVYGKEYNSEEWYEEDRDGNPTVTVQFKFYSGVVKDVSNALGDSSLCYHIIFEDGIEVQSVPQYRIRVQGSDCFIGRGGDMSVGYDGKGCGIDGVGFGHEFLEEGEGEGEGAPEPEPVEASAALGEGEEGEEGAGGAAAAAAAATVAGGGVTFNPEAMSASGGVAALTLGIKAPTPEEMLAELLEGMKKADDSTPPPADECREMLWLAEYHALQGLVPLDKLAGPDAFEERMGEGPGLDLTWDLDSMGNDQAENTLVTFADADVGITASPSAAEMHKVLDHYTKAVVLARYGHAWGVLQNSCAQIWNGITAQWASPKDFGSESAAGAGNNPNQSESQAEEGEEGENDNGAKTMDPANAKFAWRPLLACCTCLLDMVEIMQRQSGIEVKNSWSSIGVANGGDDEDEDEDSDDEEGGAPNRVLLAPVQDAGVDTVWMSRFLGFTIQVLCGVKVWPELVALGRRFNALTGNCYAEPTMAILLHAQRQRVAGAHYRLTVVQDRLEGLDGQYQAYLAKKNKKKKRLVVADVETKEEKAFKRNTKRLKCEIDHRDFQLTQYEKELHLLTDTSESLARAKSLSLEALDESRLLLQTYVRMRIGDEDHPPAGVDELSSFGGQVVNSYNHTVGILRQKREKAMLCQALVDLGNYHYANIQPGDQPIDEDDDDGCGVFGARKQAVKAWTDAVDSVFNKLDACYNWREVIREVEENDGGTASSANLVVPSGCGGECADALLRALGLWPCILAGMALTKIGQHGRFRNLHQRVEQCRLAARLFTASFSCSLPHPSRLCDFLRYKCVDLWPGVDLFGDKRRCAPGALLQSLRFCGETLLEAGHTQEAVAMAVACEHIAAHKCLSLRDTVAARLLRLEALVELGDLNEASATLGRLLAGADLPDAMLPPTSTVKAGLHGVRSDGEFSAKFFDPSVKFHNNSTPGDEINASLLEWLKDHGETQLPTALVDAYGEPLTHRLILVRAKLLARYAGAGPFANVVMSEEEAAAVGEDDAVGQYEANKRAEYVREVDTNGALAGAVEVFAVQLENSGRAIIGEKLAPVPGTEEEEPAGGGGGEGESDAELVADADPARVAVALKSVCESLLLRASLRLRRGLFISARGLVRESQTLFHKHKHQGNVHGSDAESQVGLNLWLRCLLLLAQCDLGQGRSKESMQQVSMGLREASDAKETVLSRELRLEGVKVLLCRGSLEDAENGCRSLLRESREQCREDRVYATALLLLASARRERALTTPSTAEAASHLRACRRLLSRVEKTIEMMLAEAGWVGTAHSPTSELANWYLPHTGELARTKALLARARVEEAQATAAAAGKVVAKAEGAGTEEEEETVEMMSGDAGGSSLRGTTIETLDSGLATLDHTVHSLPTLRPAMLLLRGRMGRETLQAEVQGKVKSGFEDEVDAKVREVADILAQAMTLTVEAGGHDRGIMHAVCMELASLYNMQLVPGAEHRHAAAARHFLNKAYVVKEAARQLQDNLQEMGAEANELSEEAIAELPEQAREELLSAGADDAPASAKLTTLSLLHYFVALDRERGVWPVTSQGDLTTANIIALHRFLLQNLAPYKLNCCCTLRGGDGEAAPEEGGTGGPLLLAHPLPEVEEMPTAEPGAVCVQWWQARGVEEDSGCSSDRPTVDMVMVLGDSRMVQLQLDADAVRSVQSKAAALRHALARRNEISEQNSAATKAFKTKAEAKDEELDMDCAMLLSDMRQVLGGGGQGEETLENTLELATTLTHMFDVTSGATANDEALCAWMRAAIGV